MSTTRASRSAGTAAARPASSDVPFPDVGAEAERRAAFRAFVRHHHPDVGGDPELFRAGLRAFREGRPLPRPSPSDPADRWARGPAPGDPRLDGPIVAVPGGALPRIGRLGRRLFRKYDPRPGSARVV